RLDAVVGGVEAHKTKRALRVAKLDGVMVARTEAIAQNECRHAPRIQPLGDLLALVVHRQHPVTATGADHDATVLAVGPWKINGQARLVCVFISESSG